MIGQRIMAAFHGAIEGWRGDAPESDDLSVLQHKYLENYQLYTGTAFSNLLNNNPYSRDKSIYRNTRLLIKHVQSMVDFYAGIVYPGALDLSLPEGAESLSGAVPFLAGESDRPQDLLKAQIELMKAWNWQHKKSQRPFYAAMLGDVLTEIVEDKQFPYPQIVWPGYVQEIEIDRNDNVKAYVLEYRVKNADTGETYTFRKEVDKDSFRYFRNDKPYNEHGDGPEVENPYGFVPAIWDRHRSGSMHSARGIAAIDGTKQSLMEVNSVFSHAIDFQRKVFLAPIMVSGGRGGAGTSTVDVTATGDKETSAEELPYIKVPGDSHLLQPQFDVGKTREMLQDILQSIRQENPEATFYEQLRSMTTIATETAELLMGDVGNLVDLVRSSQDMQTIKLFQMATAIAGYRHQEGAWGRSSAMSKRQLAFSRFDLDSFDRGELDMSIDSRPLVAETESERIRRIREMELVQTAWGLAQLGLDDKTAGKIIQQRADNQWRSVNGGSYRDLVEID